MDLDRVQRLTLINQYEILKRLDPGSSDRYDELINILCYGYKMFYSELVRGVDEQEMSREESQFVLEVLGMYMMIEDYKKTNPGDTEIIEHPFGTFRGFDGNNESSLLAFARFLIVKQGKFAEQVQYGKNADFLNSHMQISGKYAKMLDKWQEKGREHRLGKASILEILNAQ